MVDSYDTTSLRYLLCRAAPLSEDLENAFSERHKAARITQGDGDVPKFQSLPFFISGAKNIAH